MTESSAGFEIFRRLLSNASFEVTPNDQRSLDAAIGLLDRGTEVFIAGLAKDGAERMIAAAAQLRRAGLVPVPHLVARNIPSVETLDRTLAQLVGEVGLDRALILGGDRAMAAGTMSQSLDLLESGLFEAHGIRRLYLGCYPEVHARIPVAVLDRALEMKIAAGARCGISLTLISQFCFSAPAILAWVERIRAAGICAPLRVGLAGPASRSSLLRYALICGIGPSLAALRDREGMAQTLLSAETPEVLLRELSMGIAQRPDLNIAGTHIFTFGSLAKTAEWLQFMAKNSSGLLSTSASNG